MIFVTVGTHQQQFTRLIEAVERLPAAELVVQYGHARAPRGAATAKAFMGFAEMQRHFEMADAVVTHAGVGSILIATNAGHTPIVVPRWRRHGEHVDDHQVELVRELERTSSVIALWDVADLPRALESVPPRRPAASPKPGPLHAAVFDALRGVPSHGAPGGAPAETAAAPPSSRVNPQT